MFNVCLVLLTFGIIFIYMYVAHVLLIMSVLLPFHLTTVSCFLVLFFPFQKKKKDRQTNTVSTHSVKVLEMVPYGTPRDGHTRGEIVLGLLRVSAGAHTHTQAGEVSITRARKGCRKTRQLVLKPHSSYMLMCRTFG